MKNFRNILWGIVLIGLGLVIGLNTLEIVDIDIFFDGWWTLFIIIPCFIDLFKEDEKTGNFIGLLIGIFLLLACQGLLEFKLLWKLFFPTILVILGLSLIFKDFIHSSLNKKIKKLNEKSNLEECCATFSGGSIHFENEEFKGCNLTAVFGGVKCDLRNSVIKEDQIINASAIFGGIDIYVPKDIKVKVKSTSIFGGVDNRNAKVESDNHVLYINATCIFGGVEIK